MRGRLFRDCLGLREKELACLVNSNTFGNSCRTADAVQRQSVTVEFTAVRRTVAQAVLHVGHPAVRTQFGNGRVVARVRDSTRRDENVMRINQLYPS